MYGNNEIIAVKSSDGTTVNQNAGATKHMGIEYALHFLPNSQWEFRFNGANVQHTYLQYVLSGVNYNGKLMSAAPYFQSNLEVIYKPHFINGVRIAYEWQHQNKYFMDDMNKYEYKGFDIHNIRVGYSFNKHVEAWLNALNIFDTYYSVLATKTANTGSSSFSYYLGEPREFTFGVAYSFK
jgi:outer membrane receptor protein involved in Fe transport